MKRITSYNFVNVDENGIILDPNGADRFAWNGTSTAGYADIFDRTHVKRQDANGNSLTYSSAVGSGKPYTQAQWMELDLINPRYDAEIDDGFVIIYDLRADEYIIDVEDRITEITVLEMSSSYKTYTGEEACEYLNKTNISVGIKLPEYLADGNIVFMVGNYFPEC